MSAVGSKLPSSIGSDEFSTLLKGVKRSKCVLLSVRKQEHITTYLSNGLITVRNSLVGPTETRIINN
jgi:hypothetical protein